MFGFEFNLVFSLMPLFFLAILGVFIFVVVKGVKEWSSNNKQPIIPAEAKVVSKRTNVSNMTTGDDFMHTNTSTTYYGTFEFLNGERVEFRLKSPDYSMLAEGDKGLLEFQGTRFISFKRHI